MLTSGPTTLLLSLSIALPVLAFPSPEFSKRDVCNADNCLRNLRDARYSAKASAFCSTYIPAATTSTVRSTVTAPPPTVTSTVTGADLTITVTTTLSDNGPQQQRRDENESEDPYEEDLERRELFLDDTLDEIEDIEIQELLLRTITVIDLTSTTTSDTATSTPPISTSPATTSGIPSYVTSCNVGNTADPSRVSSACACLITSLAATTTVKTTVTSGAAITHTVTVLGPGPTTIANATIHSSCNVDRYQNYQQFNKTATSSNSTSYTFPDSNQQTKDACCNGCYGTPNCFGFLYIGAGVSGQATCRIFTTDHVNNYNPTRAATPDDTCPAGYYSNPGIGKSPSQSGYEYGPCDFASYR